MRVRTTVDSPDSYISRVQSQTWIHRIPGWLTDPKIQKPSGSSMGPRERLVLLLAFVGVLVWGFSGSWDWPTVEVEIAPSRPGSLVAIEDPQRARELGGAAAAGAELFEANGCYACHSLEGDRKIGPSLLAIHGETVELADGSSVLIDDDYIIESILDPEAKRVSGYDDASMPSYEGLVSAEDARELVEFIKSLE